MARGQGAAGRGRAPRVARRRLSGAGPLPRGRGATVRVHDLAQARDALAAGAAAGVAVRVATAEGSLPALGVGYWAAVEAELGAPVLADCEDLPGLALAGLRAGLRRLVLAGDPAVRAKVRGIAAQLGATVLDAPPPPVLAPDPGEGERGIAAALRGLDRGAG